MAGERGGVRRRERSGRRQGLWTTNSNAKRTGEGCGFSPGLLVAGDVAQMGRRRGSAAGSGRWPWTGRCGGAPRLLTRREDTGGPCEGGPGVKEALRSTAAGNFLRKGSPAAATSRAIQARTRLGLGTAGLVSLLESRRSHGELCRGRGGSGAAWPRWSRV